METTNIREKLHEIALTDALNARRMADTLREGMTAALLKKLDDMTHEQILATIEKIEAIPKIAPYREILDLLSK